jgi:hypothetical protein
LLRTAIFLDIEKAQIGYRNMKYIPTLNYMCTRHNEALCAAVIAFCETPRTRKELGQQFRDQVDSSKLSRLLFAMKRADIMEINDERQWVIGTLVKFNTSGYPFRIVPVDGVCALILRIFGTQHTRLKRVRLRPGWNEQTGPAATLNIKTLTTLINVSREVMQLRLTHLLELGLIQRKTQKRPYSYELTIMEKKP